MSIHTTEEHLQNPHSNNTTTSVSSSDNATTRWISDSNQARVRNRENTILKSVSRTGQVPPPKRDAGGVVCVCQGSPPDAGTCSLTGQSKAKVKNDKKGERGEHKR